MFQYPAGCGRLGQQPVISSVTYLPTKHRVQRGGLVATVLAGAWRSVPSRPEIAVEDLAVITPLLLQSGGAPLGWRKISKYNLHNSQAASHLQEAYRHHTLRAALHERGIKQVVTLLRSKGLEPLLGKGWAIARLYPHHGLRPYGDIDLYVRPEHYSGALAALGNLDSPTCPVDLHRGPNELDDRRFDDLYTHSQIVNLGDAEVRVFGPEDNLRLLCLHTLRHGAWRPLWLCDIAVALESRPADFNWTYFLSGNKQRSDWVACAIGLAHQLLGARVEGTPVASRAGELPRWLVPSVLRQWGTLQVPHGCRTRMGAYLRNPAGVLEALRLRWPNPIEATIGLRGPFNELPRLPFQIGDALLRTAKFLTQVPRSLMQQ